MALSNQVAAQAEAVVGLSRDQLLTIAQSMPWVHAIDVGEGVTTPGAWGKGNPEVLKACDQIDFRGKRVLDIGCWDGLWSFEAESRGASEVVGIDLISQRPNTVAHTFQLAAALRQSKARFIPDLSVYDVDQIGEKFDIILYLGVIYHLKDPLRSLSGLRQVLNDSGCVVVESAVLNEPGCSANFYYKEAFYGDFTNWWIPTRDCLRQWVECSFLKIRWDGAPFGDAVNQRHCVIAEATSGIDPLYHAAPEFLERFHV